ncbi:TPA: TcfC E-set like domain-containing protein [Photobacterium damselae]
MKKTQLSLLLPLLLGSHYGYATTAYPLEFADFFEERLETVDVVIAGGHRSLPVKADVTYETFRLQDKRSERKQLLAFLKEQKLTHAASQTIIASLLKGINANPSCEGQLALCVPKDMPNQAEFVYDFDANVLKIFVSPEMLASKSDKPEYHSALRANNALVNWSDAYVYLSPEGDNTFNWTNNAVLGLPVGYLSLESQYIHSERDLDIYRAVYNIEKGQHRGIIGYQDQTPTTLNTTDFLGYGANYTGFNATLGTSQNLLKGNAQAQQRIYFYAPQTAQLEIYQGQRLLISRTVAPGQQSIGYDELPSGVYTATIILKQGSTELLKEQQQIVNTPQFSLSIGDWDYRTELGLLDNNDESHFSTKDRHYGRAAASYRVSESVLLATGATTNIDTTEWQLGGFWAIGGAANLQYTLGLFDSGDRYQFAQLNVAPFSFSVRDVATSETSPALTQLLYGENAYTQWSLGVSASLLGGTGFVSYFKYQDNNQRAASDSDNVSLTWSRMLFGGTVSINSTYSRYGNNQNSLNTNLTWSHKLGDSVTGRAGLYFDKDGLSYNQNSLTYTQNDLRGVDSISATAGVKLSTRGESEGELSSSAYGHTSAFNYNGYGYVNTNGERSLSGNLSGTQILSAQGGALTHQRGKSFIELAPTLPKDKTVQLQYDVIKNGDYWYRDKLNANSVKMLDVSPYSEVDIKLNAEAENVDIKNNQYQHFVMPGMYYQLNSELIPLESQLFVFNDLFGKPITSLRCLGDGCENVEELSDDGVYRLNYRSQKPFKLISDKRLCVYNPEQLGQNYIQGYCLPGLDNQEDKIPFEQRPLQSRPGDVQNALLYIGKFESSQEAHHIIEQLKTVGLPSKSVTLGDAQYVYVQYLERYSLAQRTLLDNLDTYVIHDVVQPKQLFSVR